MRDVREVIANPCTALALAMIAEAMATRHGRQWIRRDRMALFWAIEAGVEHADLVSRADTLDGFRRVA